MKLVFLFFRVLPWSLSSSTRLPLRVIQTLAGLTARYGFLIPLLRPTPYVFYALLRQRSTSINLSSSALSVIRLWRHYLIFAFSHPSVLSTPIPEFYYNSSLSGSRNMSAWSPTVVFSDATLHSLGIYLQDIGWCHISVSDFTHLQPSIAILEFIAAILAFLFVHRLSPPASAHVHLFIDNQNAEAWSAGRFKSHSNLTVSLVFLNSILQSALGLVQTRSYIRSEDNIHADAISRRSFARFDSLQRFSATSEPLRFLGLCLEAPVVCPFVLLQRLPILLESVISGGFILPPINGPRFADGDQRRVLA